MSQFVEERRAVIREKLATQENILLKEDLYTRVADMEAEVNAMQERLSASRTELEAARSEVASLFGEPSGEAVA